MGCTGCIWDNQEHAQNWLKHRVRCEDACRVFEDPHAIEVHDDREDYEERWQSTGLVGAIVLVVVWTKRNGVERIISARRVDRRAGNADFAQFSS
jgi:uncharacterized DUF497 family protein